MSMFNDVDSTKEGDFQEGNRLLKKVSARTLVIPRSCARRYVVWNVRFGVKT